MLPLLILLDLQCMDSTWLRVHNDELGVICPSLWVFTKNSRAAQ